MRRLLALDAGTAVASGRLSVANEQANTETRKHQNTNLL